MGESEPVCQAFYHASWCDTLNDEETAQERFFESLDSVIPDDR